MSATQRPHVRPATRSARFAAGIRDAAPANADIAFGCLLLLTWEVTSISMRPKHLVLTAALTLVLLISAHSALGKSVWMRRMAWVAPPQSFWLYSFAGGVAAAVGVWGVTRLLKQSLGAVPAPYMVLLATSSGAMLEELLFRGLLFWVLLRSLTRMGIVHRHASIATVLLIAIAFAFSHTGRAGLSLFTTMLTGAAYGWMRVQSGSTAAAALMHGVYNFAISCIATF
jgi:membrane protease YdiL (CAAX protease family)